MTISKSIKTFINFLICNESKAQSTITSYHTDLNQFYNYLRTMFRLNNVKNITHKHILDFKDYLIRETELKDTSINRKIDCLKKFFNTLEKLNIITDNPIKFISGVRYNRIAHCNEYLTEEELAQVLDYTETLKGSVGRRDRLLIKMIVYLGLRRGDCLNLNWSNIDFEDKSVNFISEKTGQSENQLLHPKLMEELISYYNYIMPKDIDTPIFLSAEGKRLSNSAFTRIFNDLNDNCGVHKNFKITSKTFRHTLLTILVNEQNVNLMIVQNISGHRDRRSLDYYVDTTRRQKRQAINNFMADYTPSIVA